MNSRHVNSTCRHQFTLDTANPRCKFTCFAEKLCELTSKILRKFCASVGKILVTLEKFRLNLENHKEILWDYENFIRKV